MMCIRQGFLASVAAMVVVASFGCGKGEPSFPSAKLGGMVTIDGEPIEEGRIRFMPQGPDRGAPAAGDIINGRYDVDDVPLGKVRVTFRATRKTGEKVEIHGRVVEPEIGVVPEKWQDGIELEVTEDNLNLAFELSSE